MSEQAIRVKQQAETVDIVWPDGTQTSLPHLWLRDNCDCNDCRVEQTTEKKFMVTSVTVDIKPASTEYLDDTLRIVWPDGHATCYNGCDLHAFANEDTELRSEWGAGYVPVGFDFQDFLNDDGAAASAIQEFVKSGAMVLKNAPQEPNTLEQLAPRLGPIREVLFERIHNVEVYADGYNVAHTPLPLPPHNDFASYSWPPSVQALHMLVNEVPGGESVVVDGWRVLRELRAARPDLFDVLCSTPVPFRMFDRDNETCTLEPLVRCDVDGHITGLRFSNQLMQAINPNRPGVAKFYRAYHELCKRVTDPSVKVSFRLGAGEILVVASHRVLHGRNAFQASGRRHLQDAYFEFDNVRNHLVLLRRKGLVQ